MLTKTFLAIDSAIRQFFRNWLTLLLLAVVYAVLLATLFFFVTTREASLLQVILTAALAISAPLLFFWLQAASANCATQTAANSLLRKSLRDFWKVLLVSLPMIALAVLSLYLLGKFQTHFGIAAKEPTALYDQYGNATAAQSLANSRKLPLQWSSAIIYGIRYLLIGLLLPLALIQLWLATVREGLVQAVVRARDHIGRAFAPQSVLIYMCGFVVFALIPYLLLFKPTLSRHVWLEFALFAGRLGLVFFLTLFGWVTTITALFIARDETRQEIV